MPFTNYKTSHSISSKAGEASTTDSTRPALQKGVAHIVLKKATPGYVNYISIIETSNPPSPLSQSKTRKRKMLERENFYDELEAAEALIEECRAAKRARRFSENSTKINDSSNKSGATTAFASVTEKRKADVFTESEKQARDTPVKRPHILTGVNKDDERDSEDVPTTLPPPQKGRRPKSEAENAADKSTKKAVAAVGKATKATYSLLKSANKTSTTVREMASVSGASSSTKQLPTPDGSSSPQEAKTGTVEQYRYDYKGEKIVTNSEVVYACHMANLRQQIEAKELHKWADIHGINYNGNDMNLLYKNSEHFILINGDRLDRWYGFKPWPSACFATEASAASLRLSSAATRAAFATYASLRPVQAD